MDQYTLNSLVGSELQSTYGDVSKAELLAQKKEEKLQKLGGLVQGANLADSYSISPNGTQESNRNKVWNTLNPMEFQYVTGRAMSKYYMPEEQMTSSTGRRFYDYTTKDDGTKVGLSTGGAGTSDVRYDNTIDPRYTDEWRQSHATGPDLNRKNIDAPMDFEAATVLEGIHHGNERTLGMRKYPNYLSREALQQPGGVSEYYNADQEQYWGDASNSELTPERMKELDTWFDSLVQEQKQARYGTSETSGGLGGKGYLDNLVDAAQYGVGSAAARVGDAIADAIITESTGKWLNEKLGDEWVTAKGDWTALDKYKLAKEYGYDDRNIQEYVTEFKDTFNDPEASWVDKTLVTLKAVKHAPEVLASSSGDIALAAMGPLGVAAMAAGVGNDWLAEREATKGKIEAEDYAIVYPMAAMYAAVNKFTGGNAGLSEAKKVVKESLKYLDANAAKQVMGASLQLAKSTGKAGAVEGVEEIFQGYTEEVGTKLGTEKADEIWSRDTLIEKAAEGALGFGAGAATKGVREVPGTVGKLAGALNTLKHDMEMVQLGETLGKEGTLGAVTELSKEDAEAGYKKVQEKFGKTFERLENGEDLFKLAKEGDEAAIMYAADKLNEYIRGTVAAKKVIENTENVEELGQQLDNLGIRSISVDKGGNAIANDANGVKYKLDRFMSLTDGMRDLDVFTDGNIEGATELQAKLVETLGEKVVSKLNKQLDAKKAEITEKAKDEIETTILRNEKLVSLTNRTVDLMKKGADKVQGKYKAFNGDIARFDENTGQFTADKVQYSELTDTKSVKSKLLPVIKNASANVLEDLKQKIQGKVDPKVETYINRLVDNQLGRIAEHTKKANVLQNKEVNMDTIRATLDNIVDDESLKTGVKDLIRELRQGNIKEADKQEVQARLVEFSRDEKFAKYIPALTNVYKFTGNLNTIEEPKVDIEETTVDNKVETDENVEEKPTVDYGSFEVKKGKAEVKPAKIEVGSKVEAEDGTVGTVEAKDGDTVVYSTENGDRVTTSAKEIENRYRAKLEEEAEAEIEKRKKIAAEAASQEELDVEGKYNEVLEFKENTQLDNGIIEALRKRIC